MDLVKLVDGTYPRPKDAEYMKYGTAGFRDNAANLSHIMARIGAVAVIASLKNQGNHVGLVITASHNPAPDNGVKLVDSDGAMVKPNIEAIAVILGNSTDFLADLETMLKENGAPSGFGDHSLKKCHVVIGRDTRESSPRFAEAASAMARALGATVIDLGIVSTPMLHFGVWHQYKFGSIGTPELYFKYFEARLLECCPKTEGTSDLCFDGACGVGAIQAVHFIEALNKLNIKMSIINKPEDGQLNYQCGSDYVQTSQSRPMHCDLTEVRCCSVDGDADRIVYHFTDKAGNFHLIDGDKIACLYLKIINEFIVFLGECKPDIDPLNVTIVQTAYANGASTIAMQEMMAQPGTIGQMTDVVVDLRCTKTGVKNLHHVAEEYDIGVYFEANGHGTVIYNSEKLNTWAKNRGISDAANFKKLIAFLDLFNASIGDAFTDMLACEAGLKILNWSIADWSAMYTMLPCSQTKVYLPKEKMAEIKPHPEHERWLVSPLDVQESIDAAYKPLSKCRAFVRPSGTEPLVRLYVEAENVQDRDQVVKQLTDLLVTRFK